MVEARRSKLAALKGLFGPRFRRIQRQLAVRVFDRGGLDTVEPASIEDLGLGEHMHPYKASGRFFLRRALRAYEIGPADVFVDLGSGKGRIVCLAARYPFARVIGVELSGELSRIAQHNLETRRQRLACQRVELVTADLTAYEIPDDATFLYMFNPVDGPLFSAMLANIIASLDRRPRALRLIYVAPAEAAQIEASGRFRLVRASRGIRLDLPPSLLVYEALPPAAGTLPPR
ncbi:MAG: hypothetical protein QOG09_837 [Solirubrobacterales bacterium]|nr:hypothetical protein [Solirubrobacterales bacterium]